MLLNTIDQLVRHNNGGCYTDKELEEVWNQIQKEEKVLKLSPGNMSEEEIRKQAKSIVSKKQVDDAAPTGGFGFKAKRKACWKAVKKACKLE
ncbi:hypothetical protein EYF80_061211 [Liparis tanakae]|uniref:Uncharacterized protein n=1 Tax=Liparis tanakae TaxID=230148 RepID=A0A4Z2EJX2_9TELE|nr:hypothetical protein EYF80_061211 [Liparis tanakae]